MTKNELQRLTKIEDRIYQIASDNGLCFCDIEFDVIPQEKMFEMMAYGMPGQISNWKYGRDYERTRTIYEKMGIGLPYEVVVNTDPARAYLMKDNVLSLQALILAHVVGHVAFFTMNRFHQQADNDIASRLSVASQRFEEYEKKYGIDLVEQTIDSGHAIMLHSNPWIKDETEQDKLDRIFDQMKQMKHDRKATDFYDMFEDEDKITDKSIERWNHELYLSLKNKTPVEPQEDILRYLIDHSRNISNWQKDILEIIRSLGQYYWPNIKTKFMNEGFATYCHEFIFNQLTKEGLLDAKEHSECTYVNSIVKAKSPFSMNPYLIGCEIWEDIVRRWNTGQHGRDWENISDFDEKENYDDKSMKGHEKMLEVLRTHQDWMFMNNFLTTKLVRELELYMFVNSKSAFFEELVVADKDAEEIREIIIKSFSHSRLPKVVVKNGNYKDKWELLLEHEFIGAELDTEYAQKTLEHIEFLWGNTCYLNTKKSNADYQYVAMKKEQSSTPSTSKMKMDKLNDPFDDEYLPTSQK